MSVFSRLLAALGFGKKAHTAALPLFESTVIAMAEIAGGTWRIEAQAEAVFEGWMAAQSTLDYLSFFHAEHGSLAWLVTSGEQQKPGTTVQSHADMAAGVESVLAFCASEQQGQAERFAGHCGMRAKGPAQIKALWSRLPALKIFSLKNQDQKGEYFLLMEEVSLRYIRRSIDRVWPSKSGQEIAAFCTGRNQLVLDDEGKQSQVTSMVFKQPDSFFAHDFFVPNMSETAGQAIHCHASSIGQVADYNQRFGAAYKAAGFKAINQNGVPIEWWYVVYGNWGLGGEQVLDLLKQMLKHAMAMLKTYAGFSLARLSFAPLSLPPPNESNQVINYRVGFSGATSAGLAVCVPSSTVQALAQAAKPLLQLREEINQDLSISQALSKLRIKTDAPLGLAHFLMALGPADSERCLSAFIGLGHGLSDLFDFFVQAWADPKKPEQIIYYQQDGDFDHELFLSRLGQRWRNELSQHYKRYTGKVRLAKPCPWELELKQKELMVGLYHFVKTGRLLVSASIKNVLYQLFELPFEQDCARQARAHAQTAIQVWQADNEKSGIKTSPRKSWFVADESLIAPYANLLSTHDRTAIEEEILKRKLRIKDGILVLPNYQLLEEILQH